MNRSIEEWVERYERDELGEEEALTLAQLLDSDPEARAVFVQLLTEDAAIGSALSGRDWSMAATSDVRRARRRPWLWRGVAAACLAGFATLAWLLLENEEAVQDIGAPARAVATLNTTRDAVWSESHADAEGWLFTGAYQLESGSVTFTCDSGAVVSVSGPAAFELVSPFKMELRRGEASFFVDEPAHGFIVNTPHATVEDWGTAFSVLVDDAADGGSDVHVVDGEVRVSSPTQSAPVAYGAREAVRVDVAGKTNSIKFRGDRMKVPRPQARGAVGAYIHLPLDERRDDPLSSSGRGFKRDKQFFVDAAQAFGSAMAPVVGAGKFGQALHFDGRGGALSFDFAGGRSGQSNTLALWVLIPPDASPHESTFLEFRNVYSQGDRHSLSWNPDDRAGAYGALRVNYGNGYVTGSTPINDGAWHHIVIVSRGGKQLRLATHVRLYVDSRLDEPSVIKDEAIRFEAIPRQRPTFTGFAFATAHPFRGALDELFITGGQLLPHEIYGLYQTNKLPIGMNRSTRNEKAARTVN